MAFNPNSSGSPPIMGSVSHSLISINALLAQINDNIKPQSWKVHLDLLTDLLKVISSEKVWPKNEVEAPTEYNQHIPQIRGLIQALERSQGKRLEDIGSKDDYKTSLALFKGQTQEDNTLNSLDLLTREAEALYFARRARINIHSRGIPRPVDIRDLPDEILTKIAAFMRDRRSRSDKEEKVGVQDFRLTSWRFCNIGSPFLIQTLQVEMSPASVSRLLQVSCHPTISKGVRKLKVNLRFYSPTLAENLEDFAHFQSKKLRRWIFEMETLRDATHQNDTNSILRSTLIDAIKKGHDLAYCWVDLTREREVDNPGALHDSLSILKKAQADYRSRFMQQEILREGSLSQAISAALARMPSVTELKLRDSPYNTTADLEPWDALLDADLLAGALVYPISCEEAKNSNLLLGSPPLEQLVKIPLAFYNAGVPLRSLSILISSPVYLGAIEIASDEIDDFTASIQNLEAFFLRFVNSTPHVAYRHLDECLPLCSYLSAVLNTASLKRLTIDLSDLRDTKAIATHDFRFLQLISEEAIKKWKNVKRLHLTSVTINLEDLKDFVEQVLHPGIELVIRKVDLLSGSWADALDILRAKCGPHTVLLKPYGAEIEDMPWNLIHSIFNKPPLDNSCPSPANAYLRGHTNVNPLRKLVEDLADIAKVQGEITHEPEL